MSCTVLKEMLLQLNPLSSSETILSTCTCAFSSGLCISCISICGFSIPNFFPISSVSWLIVWPPFPIAKPGLTTCKTILVTKGVFTISKSVKPAISSCFFTNLVNSIFFMLCSMKNLSIMLQSPVQSLLCARIFFSTAFRKFFPWAGASFS